MSERFPEEVVVHVVDDDGPFRTAIARLLRTAGYNVCAYESAGEFALTCGEGARGCLLLDVRMPGPSGMDLQASLARAGNSIPVVMITGNGNIAMSVRAMKSGAVDFLTKPVKRDDLLAAVEAALARDLAGLHARNSLRSLRQRFESLTQRECQVFRRVTEGQPNKQIAFELGAAERTIKAHRAQVMEKMGAASLADLVHIAEELGRPAAP